MKKIVFAAFIAFWASVGTLVALQAMAPDHATPANDGLPVFALAEVARHNTLDDCWMAIEGKVYDFTDYVPQHPTPPTVLEPWCGREATEGMRTKGYGRDHSRRAWALMDDYLIGELKDD
ncbi:MAG: cytochrome b5 domain-containing protein [Wenzhouxiangella sp.]